MNLPPRLRKEMHELCCVYLLERMTVEQAARLENLVINNRNACQFFVESMSIDAHLQWGATPPTSEGFLFVSDQSAPLSQKEVDAASRRIAQLPRATGWKSFKQKMIEKRSLLLLTGVIFLFCIFLAISFSSSPQSVTVTHTHHVVWSTETPPIKEQGTIKAEAKNELLEGSVELLFPTGVKVMVAAPATFKITGENEINLSRGMLFANVTTEEGKGFTVKTPSGSITDLGTLFGVEVDLTGTSSTQVFKGKVQLTSSSGIKSSLSAGSTMQCKVGEREWQPSEKLSNEFYSTLQENDPSHQALKTGVVFIHRTGNGIPGVDKYAGISYLMYSKTPIGKRFAADLMGPWDTYTQHFVAVHFNKTTQKWQFQENQTLHEFKPVSTDLIIARTEPVEKLEGDVWSRKVILFEKQSGNIHGIPFGYTNSDITIHPNMLAGKPNAGEFTLKGTYFIRHTK